MSSYLARLKQLESEKNLLYSPDPVPAKGSKGAFGGFGGTPQGVYVKKYSNTFGISDHTAESPKDEKLLELNSLLRYVALENGFTESDLEEAKFLANKDVELALTSFRALARDIRRDRGYGAITSLARVS